MYLSASSGQGTSGAPGPGCRVVHLRAGEITAVPKTSSDEEAAIWQQRRCMVVAAGDQRAGGAPDTGARVLHLGGGEIDVATRPPCDEYADNVGRIG